MLVRAELITGHTDLVEQLCLLEGVKRHGQGRGLADRQTYRPGRNSRRDHDLTALLAAQGRRHHWMLRTDVLAGVTGGGSRQMRQISVRQSRRVMPGPTAGPFHEDLARAVDDDFGQALVRQVWRQRLEIALQDKAATIAFARCRLAHFVTTAGATMVPGMVRSRIRVRVSIRRS